MGGILQGGRIRNVLCKRMVLLVLMGRDNDVRDMGIFGLLIPLDVVDCMVYPSLVC